mgnify:CR=1 FL=1
MKRGLKRHLTDSLDNAGGRVRTQAPMKRGLKQGPASPAHNPHHYRPNPGPDEEGIETTFVLPATTVWAMSEPRPR